MSAVGDGRQLLANTVMKIVSQTLLLLVGNLQNFPFQTFSFGGITGDALNFDELPGLLDSPGVDLQFQALPGSTHKIPIRRWQFHSGNHLLKPFPGGRALFFNNQINEIFGQNVFLPALQQRRTRLVEGSYSALQIMSKNHVIGIFKQLLVTRLHGRFRLKLFFDDFSLLMNPPPQ